MSQFIGELFDTDISYTEDSIIHSSELIHFEILECKDTHHHCSGMRFTVKNSEELTSVKQKLEFFCYRQKLDLSKFILEDSITHLVIKDPDYRPWTFSTLP
jgi:hypothetical protein